jgi:hypothetical protein
MPARMLMNTRASAIRDIMRALGALALGLWLGGAGCLACCAESFQFVRMAADGAVVRAPAADAEGASAAPHCAAHGPRPAITEFVMDVEGEASAQDSSAAFLSRAGEAAPCCRRAGQVADHARRLRVTRPPSSAPAVGAIRPARARAASANEIPARAFVPDRGGTRARLCVLLI